MTATAEAEAATKETPEGGGQELAKRNEGWMGKPMIDLLDRRQLALIKETVAKGATDPELGMFLEIASALDLNPFTGEIWCAISQRDGGRRQVLMMVGRDGLLKVARRDAAYKGYDSGVVREKDVYERVKPDAQGETLRERAGVVHEGKGFGGARGKIVGAWCAVEIKGRPPRVFEAPLEEYMPTSEAKVKYSPWGSNLSVMIEKCALSVAHRTSFNLQGVLGEGEEARMIDGAPGVADLPSGPEAVRDAVDALSADTDVKRRILEAALALNEIERDLYNPARLQMTLMGQPEETIAAEADRMEAELEERRAAVEAEEAITDAEVVDGEADRAQADDTQAGDPRVDDGHQDAELTGSPTPAASPRGASEPSAPAESPEPVVDPAERRVVVEARMADLEERMAETEPGSIEFDAYSAEMDSLTTEMEGFSDDA